MHKSLRNDTEDLGKGDGARGSPRRSQRSRRFLGEDNARGGGPRNDTEDHGNGDGVVLVLSAAVLVIVIDARDVGRAGMARGV